MWVIFLCHSYTRSWSAVFSLCSLQATLSPMQALLFPGEHFRKLFWCLAKLVQLGAWLQGLLWQHEQPIRGKAVFSVGVWGVCLCVHMGVCSTEERNDITTKGGLVTPHKTPRWPQKPRPSFLVEWTPDTIAIAISRRHEVDRLQII